MDTCDTSHDESQQPPTCMTTELSDPSDTVTDTLSPVFNSPEPIRQSRRGRQIKAPAVFSLESDIQTFLIFTASVYIV